jgi:thiol-disulfide isomerase/thioredoxin
MVNINITQKWRNLLNINRFNILSTIFFIIIFLIVSYITYNSYIKYNSNKLDKLVELDELTKKGTTNGSTYILIYRFYTTWCPACKKTENEWIMFEQFVKDKYQTQNGNIYVETKKIDCDIETNQKIVDKYKIDSYPTIKLISNNEIFEYNTKIEVEQLKNFLFQAIEKLN